MKGLKPAVFLDRDGTINVEKEYLYKIEDFEYLDGVVEGLRQLCAWGYSLVIITNQSGIARGYYREEDFFKLTNWMLADLEGKGIHIERVYHCPHHPEGQVGKLTKICKCRKPKTGLFYQAAAELELDLNRSIAIGDRPRDLAICNETAVKGVLLSDSGDKSEGYLVCRDWKEITDHIGMLLNFESIMKNTDYINNCLQKFDLVLLIMNGSGAAENLAESFLKSEALQKAAEKVLVLSDRNIPYIGTHHQYRRLNTEDLEAIRNIYFMYDFSDRFRVLTDSRQYGGLLDDVKTGLLTMEDVFQTVLGL